MKAKARAATSSQAAAEAAAGQAEARAAAKAATRAESKASVRTAAKPAAKPAAKAKAKAKAKAGPVTIAKREAVMICHRTTNPNTARYNLIPIARNAIAHHRGHGDVFPTNGRCPDDVTPPPSPGLKTVMICHKTNNPIVNRYFLIPISRNGIAHHRAHGDVSPTNGTCPDPTRPPPNPPGRKTVMICHKTVNPNVNRYHLIPISRNGIDHHKDHGDVFPTNGRCPDDSGSPRPRPPRPVPDGGVPGQDVRMTSSTQSRGFQAFAFTTTTTGTGELPATGFDAVTGTLLGLLLMVVGLGLNVAGKRRPAFAS